MRFHLKRSDTDINGHLINASTLDPDQGLGDGVRQRHHVLQGEERRPRRGQRGRLQRVLEAAGRHHPEECAGDNDAGRNIVD